MHKVTVPVKIRLLIKTGEDITVCTTCKAGHYQIMDTIIPWKGNHLSVRDIRSRGKP